MNIKNLLKNDFVKNVLTLFSSSAISQVFLFLLMPVLTRLYSDELFGLYFIVVSTINILKKVTTLRFELAIILPKKNIWAINAWAVTVFFTIVISSFFLIISIVFKNILSKIPDIEQVANYLYLIPVSLFLTGIYESFSLWNNRFKSYKKITAGKISLSLSTGLSQLGFGLMRYSSFGLFFGLLIGQFISVVTIVGLSMWSIMKYFKYISVRRMKIILKRYINIPIFNTLVSFLTNFSNEIPIYLLTGFYSPMITGLYGMANKITATPMNMLGTSIGQVFYQRASEKYSNNESIEVLVKKMYVNLLKISILPILGIAIIAPFIHYILGDDWTGLTFYIFLLIPPILANFLIQPVSAIYTIYEKQNIMFVFLVISSVLKIVAVVIGAVLFSNPLISVALLSFVTTIFRLFLMFWFYKLSKNKKIVL